MSLDEDSIAKTNDNCRGQLRTRGMMLRTGGGKLFSLSLGVLEHLKYLRRAWLTPHVLWWQARANRLCSRHPQAGLPGQQGTTSYPITFRLSRHTVDAAAE